MLTETKSGNIVSSDKPNWMKKALRVEWLGQTMASLFWIVSVFTYGISATGDWLQLFAASAWLVANIAALTSSDSTDSPE